MDPAKRSEAGGRLVVLAPTDTEARAVAAAARAAGLAGRIAVELMGIGPERAERVTRAVLARERPSALLLVGIAGGLEADLGIGAAVRPSSHRGLPDSPGARELTVDGELARCLDEALAEARIEVRVGPFLTSERVLSTHAEKRAAAADGCVAVEMEGLAVARVAAEHGVPFGSLRTVLDPVERSFTDLSHVLDDEGRPRLGVVLREVARRPSLLVELLRLAGESRRALDALERALVAVLAAPTGILVLHPSVPEVHAGPTSRRNIE